MKEDIPTEIERFLDVFRKIYNSTDSEMRDGDFARAIAWDILYEYGEFEK
jgi:hypothetical protein